MQKTYIPIGAGKLLQRPNRYCFIEIRVQNGVRRVEVPEFLRAEFRCLIAQGNRTRPHCDRYRIVMMALTYAYLQGLADNQPS